MRGMLRTVAALFLVLSVVAATPVAAQESTTPSFVVDLNEDGSAEVALTLTYDLENQEEQDAFEQLRNDSEARADAQSDFRTRMEAVANDSEAATGREMSIEDTSIDLRTEDGGDLGVVELSVTWNGLAAVEGDRLTVTEPFASGFEPDREFTVRGPDGHEVSAATPAPGSEGKNSITYEAGTSLDGFEATFVAAATTAGTPTATEPSTPGGETDQPGLGVPVAVVALLGAALLARRE